MKVGAVVHRALRFWLFRVPSENMATMRLFSLIDLPFLVGLPLGISLNTARWLKTFQKQLPLRIWPSLAKVYPRPVMWAYAYLLFSWGRYCNMLSAILDQPERSLPAEIFLRQICTMDAYVDSFDSQALWRHEPEQIDALPQVQAVAEAFCWHVENQNLSSAEKAGIFQLAATYRRDALAAMKRWAQSPSQTLPDVIRDKEATTGNLWYTWSQILGRLYRVPADLAECASHAFFCLGMMLQIIDDLGDVPVDHKVRAQNLFLSMVQDTPQEWEALIDFLNHQSDLFLDWPKARSMLPVSYKKNLELFHSYQSQLLADETNPLVVHEWRICVERLRSMAG